MLSFYNNPELKKQLITEGEYHAAHNMLAHVGYGDDKLAKSQFRRIFQAGGRVGVMEKTTYGEHQPRKDEE